MKKTRIIVLVIMCFTLLFCSGCSVLTREVINDRDKYANDVYTDISWEDFAKIADEDNPGTTIYSRAYTRLPKLVDKVDYVSFKDRYAYLKGVDNPRSLVESMVNTLFNDGYSVMSYDLSERNRFFYEQEDVYDIKHLFSKDPTPEYQKYLDGLANEENYTKIEMYKDISTSDNPDRAIVVVIDFFEYTYKDSMNVCIKSRYDSASFCTEYRGKMESKKKETIKSYENKINDYNIEQEKKKIKKESRKEIWDILTGKED